jgi:hypothetical protein
MIMAAKKRSAKRKKVTVEIDAETLLALMEAADALAEIIANKVMHHHDPEMRRLAKKRSKKRR